MFNRYTASLTMALLLLFAASGVAHAADDREEVIFGTAGVALGLVVLVGIAYAIKHAMGLDKMPPPDPNEGHGGHH